MGTIIKALNLLGNFSEATPEIGLSEFHKLANRDKATVYRHLCELEAAGFVEQDAGTKKYRLGPAVLRLANVRERTFPARDAVAPAVKALSAELGELAHVSLLQGRTLLPLYHYDAEAHGTLVHFDVGYMLPMHATASGVALLAFSPPEFVDGVLAVPLERFTEKTLTDPQKLRAQIEKARALGYGASDEGFELEVGSFAVPLFNKDQQAAGTLAVAVPLGRSTAKKRREIVPALKRAGCVVTEAMGGTVPGDYKRLSA